MMNKKGSTSVFLVFILTAMVILTAAFVYIVKQTTAISYGDGLITLSGKSILSEFDLELKDKYGLFAFESNGEEVSDNMEDYLSYSLKFNADVEVEEIVTDFGDYSLGNVKMLKVGILEHMKFRLAEQMMDKEEKSTVANKKDRTLRNRKIIDSLPSAPLKESSPGFSEWVKNIKSQMGSIDEIFNQAKDTYLVGRYILSTFKNAQGGPIDRNTFFDHEVEYILEGNFSNEKNRKGVRKGLVLLRSSLNAVHLYMDPEKRAKTLAAAELLTPGPAAPLTQAVLIATWSLAEAENDARLLDKGKKVAVFKSKATWATDLDSVLKNQDKGCIDTDNDEGLNYEDYLLIFLHFQNENIKLARVLDLIQINMKGTYNRDFSVRTFNCGFHLKTTINNKSKNYDIKY